MPTLTVCLSDEKHRRIKALTQSRGGWQGNRMNAFGQQNNRFYPLQKAHEGEKGCCRGDF
jgi:hypothetical protein